MFLTLRLNIGQNGTYTDLTFATWMIYNVPPMLVNVFIAWMYLVVVFFGFNFGKKNNSEDRMLSAENQNNVQKMLESKYKSLGSMSFHEVAVAILFFIAVMLWLFREPKFMPGWASVITENPNFRIGDSTPAMLVVMFLFIIPKHPMAMFRSKYKILTINQFYSKFHTFMHNLHLFSQRKTLE